MDERLPEYSETQRGSRRWKRDWYPYDGYVDLHDSHMDDLRSKGYVLRENIEFVSQLNDDGSLRLVIVKGRIECADSVMVRVHKVLAVRRGKHNRHVVRTIEYSYQAWVKGEKRRLFRYDNAHDDLGSLHKHVYDDRGREIRIEAVSPDEMPRLDLIVRMAVEAVRTGLRS